MYASWQTTEHFFSKYFSKVFSRISLLLNEFLRSSCFHVPTGIQCPRLLNLREEDREGDWSTDRKNKLDLLASFSSTSWYSFNIAGFSSIPPVIYSFNILTKCVTTSPLIWLYGGTNFEFPKSLETSSNSLFSSRN